MSRMKNKKNKITSLIINTTLLAGVLVLLPVSVVRVFSQQRDGVAAPVTDKIQLQDLGSCLTGFTSIGTYFSKPSQKIVAGVIKKQIPSFSINECTYTISDASLGGTANIVITPKTNSLIYNGSAVTKT
jgi:hypothetical protein